MEPGEKNHYEVLGLSRDARHTDIGIAYHRIMGRRRSEHAPPDPRGDARIAEAFEVLNDPDSREYYDADLRAQLLRRPVNPLKVAGGAAFAVALVAGGWFLLKPSPSLKLEAEAPQKIAAAATPSVGRLERLQVSGGIHSTGVAFAIEANVMATTCHRLVPGTQLIVTLMGRKVPSSVESVDERTGLCRLASPHTGSWPLPLTDIEPKAGDRVFSARVGEKGDLRLMEGKVKRVVDHPAGRVFETTVDVGPDAGGAPLFDVMGRVVAVATFADNGAGLHVALPESWKGPRSAPSAAAKAATAAARREPPKQAAREPGSPVIDDGGAGRKPSPSSVSPERRKALEKAFRPPPHVPDDL